MRWFRRRRQQDRVDALEEHVRRMSVELAGASQTIRLFQVICAEFGIPLESAAGDAVPGISPALLAATRAPRSGGEPVRLDVDGVQMIAVVSGEGDPAAWQHAITAYARPPYGTPAGATGIGHAPLPEGLWALGRRTATTTYLVNDSLPHSRQVTAMRTARQAARRSGWRAGGLAPVALFAWRGALRSARAHAAASTAAGAALAGVTIAAVAFLAPGHPAHYVSSRPRPRPSSALAAGRRGGARPRSSSPAGGPSRSGKGGPKLASLGVSPPRPGQPHTGSVIPGGLTVPSPRITLPVPVPSVTPPVPLPSPTIPVPTPTLTHLPSPPPLPTPSPSATVKVCLKWKIVLGLKICVKWGIG